MLEGIEAAEEAGWPQSQQKVQRLRDQIDAAVHQAEAAVHQAHTPDNAFREFLSESGEARDADAIREIVRDGLTP